MKIKIPPQINRLVILFIIVTGLFLIIRQFLIPDTFGDLGHYRAASLQENESAALHFAGDEACMYCHEDIFDLKNRDLHIDLACEICHGPGQSHVQSMDATDIMIPAGRDYCGRCHAVNAARPVAFVKQVDLATHNVELDCTECHNAHQPWEALK